jgi:hypothetical protein
LAAALPPLGRLPRAQQPVIGFLRAPYGFDLNQEGCGALLLFYLRRVNEGVAIMAARINHLYL